MKARLTVTVDPEVLERAKAILEGTGITLSGFVGVSLQGLVNSCAKPMRAMYEDMAKSMVKEITRAGKGKRKK